MAEQVSFTLPSPYQAEMADIARRQRMAELMQQQAFQPAETFSYNGIQARTSPLTGLAKALQGYMAVKTQKDLANEQKALGERAQRESASDIATLFGNMQGQEAMPARAPATATDDEGNFMPMVAATPARAPGTLDPSILAKLRDPQVKQIAMSQLLAQMAKEREQQEFQRTLTASQQGQTPTAVAPVAPPMNPMIPGQPGSSVMAGAEGTTPPVAPVAPQVAPQAAPQVRPGTSRYNLEALAASGNPRAMQLAEFLQKANPKTEFSPIDVKDYTPESIALALRPDGTVDRSKLRAVGQPRAGELGVYDEYVKQMQAQGKTPVDINEFTLRKVREGRTPGAVTFGSPVAAQDAAGNPVFLQPSRTGGAPSVLPGFTPPGEKLKTIPPNINTAITQNQVLLNKITRAEDLVTENPNATGLMKGALPTGAVNRMDKAGIATRAAITELAASKIHDLSGAAVSVSEFARLKPFLPQPSDNAEILQTKLAGMKKEIQDILNLHGQMYSQEQGYRPNPVLSNLAPVATGQTATGRIRQYNPATGRIE